MTLTPHFALAEFACRDGTCVPDELVPNVRRLAGELEQLRRFLGKPIVILSGYRTPAWNTGKGVEHSQHLTASAADIRVAGLSPQVVHDLAIARIAAGDLKLGGVGLYLPGEKRAAGWVHLDIGPPGRRWRG